VALKAGAIDATPLVARTIGPHEQPDAFCALAAPHDCTVIVEYR
jgi:hypothetical protein